MHRQLVCNYQPRDGERMGCAAHVLFHQPHSAGGLEVETAAVETHALADDRDPRGVRLAPLELDQARRARLRRSAADCRDQRIARGEFLTRSHPNLSTQRGSRVANGLLEFRWTKIAGRRVDEVADQRGRFGEPHGSIDARRFARD